MILVNRILDCFFCELSSRFGKGIYTTEDTVRYVFFNSILNNTNLSLDNFILEYKPQEIPGCEIDLFIPPLFGFGLSVEIKFHRGIPSGKRTPVTQLSAKVFNDLYRLGKIRANVKKLFVYVSGGGAVSYFKNKRNGFDTFFMLQTGYCLSIDSSFVGSKSMTFRNNLDGVPDVSVRALLNKSLPDGYELRVYEVNNI